MKRSPCAKLTMSMIPKIRVSPEATSARIMPFTSPLTICTRICSYGMIASDSQVLVDGGVVGPELDGGRVMTDDALLHDVDAVGHVESQGNVLLDQQDGHAVPVEDVDDLAD